MGDTVSNQGRTVVHKGSSHTAIATSPDVCKVPPGIPVPFENTLPAARITALATVSTLIQGNPICIQGTMIGPPSDAAHAGVMGGVGSGTYRQEAVATSWSPDVFAEAKAVVREKDTTTQNHGNTTGMLVAGTLVASAQGFEDLLAKRCKADPLDGACEHGRELGWPTPVQNGEPEYLEVLLNESIEFGTWRWDITATPPALEPACPVTDHVHTYWTAEAIQYPLRTKKTMSQEGGTTFVVPTNLAIGDGLASTMLEYLLDGSKPKFKNYDQTNNSGVMTPQSQAQVNQIWADRAGNQTGSTKRGAAKRQAARRDKADQAVAVDRKEHAETNGSVKNKLDVDIWSLVALWAFYIAQPSIVVSATACAGSRKATLKVYPNRKYEFAVAISSLKAKTEGTAKFEKEHQTKRSPIDGAVAALYQLKKITDVASKIADLAGYTLKVKLLDGFKLKVALQYIENTETKGFYTNYQHTPAMVGLNFEVTASADPLVSLEAKFFMSLFNFAAPGLGEGTATLLRRAGIRADIECGMKLSMLLDFKGGKDEYDYLKFGGVTFGGDLKLWMSLVLGAVIGEVVLTAEFPGSGRFTFTTGLQHSTLFEVQPVFKIRSEFVVEVRGWGWFSWELARAVPPKLAAEWNNGGKPFGILSLPS